jgi:hypothetical protein
MVVYTLLVAGNFFEHLMDFFILQKGRNCIIYPFLLPHTSSFLMFIMFLWGFQLCQWIESCIARNMYHTYTTQKHTSNSATVWEPSIFFFFSILILLAFLNPFFLFIISDIAWCILISYAERNSMEQGRKVSEHATPLARNFSSIGKDVESGNVPLVRIFFIASWVLSRGATLFPAGVCSLLLLESHPQFIFNFFCTGWINSWNDFRPNHPNETQWQHCLQIFFSQRPKQQSETSGASAEVDLIGLLHQHWGR